MLGLLFAGFLFCCGVTAVAWAVLTPPRDQVTGWEEDDILWAEEYDDQMGVVIRPGRWQ